MVFEGSGVALVTPFTYNGAVNYGALANLIEMQIKNGTKAIVILGTTGEGSTITYPERSEIIKYAVHIVAGRVPLIVGTGSNSTEVAVSMSYQAAMLGADAVMVVTPYYNKCNQQGLIAHYKRIAASIEIPLILYNVPSRTGVNMLPKTVLELSRVPNIVGIKEASGNLDQISSLLRILPPDFAVYSGDDSLTYPLMALGAKGVVSVTANCYPKEVSDMCNYMLQGDFMAAKDIHNSLHDINKAMFLDVNPICVKAYMNLMGLNVGSVRLPLTEATEEIRKQLSEVEDEHN